MLVRNVYKSNGTIGFWKKHGIAKGVKQGGVLSPIFFGIYMDHLIKRLKDRNIGCKIGNNFVGVVCYADDLTLISPILTGLKCMLSICENYADEYKILFNASKSQLQHFIKSNTQEKDILEMNNNKTIESTDKCVYLGIPLNACKLNNDFVINKYFVILIGALTIYLLISHWLRAIYYLYYLILTVCIYMYYRRQLFKLYDKTRVNCISDAWRKAIRKN